MKKLYYDPAHTAGFAGKRKLLSATRKKIPEETVSDWLDKQTVYNKHRPVIRKFTHRPYTVDNVDDLWESDLMQMTGLKSYNDDYSFLLLVVDVFSKYLWLQPMKNKSAQAVVAAFREILKRSRPRICLQIQTDSGKEYMNSQFQSLLQKNGIKFRTARNPAVKASVAERAIRTVRDRIERYLSYSRNRRYIDILPKIVDSYNRSYHRTICTTPESVTIDNAAEVRDILRQRRRLIPKEKIKYRLHEIVRISTEKTSFRKGSQSGWSEEVFYIHRILDHRQPVVYEVAGLNDEPVDGIFYKAELSSVGYHKPSRVLKVNKVLDKRGRGSSRRVLVNWKGLPEDLVSWILER